MAGPTSRLPGHVHDRGKPAFAILDRPTVIPSHPRPDVDRGVHRAPCRVFGAGHHTGDHPDIGPARERVLPSIRSPALDETAEIEARHALRQAVARESTRPSRGIAGAPSQGSPSRRAVNPPWCEWRASRPVSGHDQTGDPRHQARRSRQCDPVAECVRRHPRASPAREISLLTTAPYAAWLSQAPWFDDVLIDTRPEWWNLPGVHRLRRMLTQPGFARVYDLQTSSRSSHYFQLVPAQREAGMVRHRTGLLAS